MYLPTHSGPTLLFERYYSDREARQFFACAVHRDRKGCPFFQWADEPISEEKRQRWVEGAKHKLNIVERGWGWQVHIYDTD